MKKAALLLLAFMPAYQQRACAIGGMEGGQTAISRWTSNSGGGLAAGGSFRLNTAAGETVFSGAAGGDYSLRAGYAKIAAQPGSVVAITAVTKTTGTLELEWNAPGADGFQGAVNDGFYRLDYSSDPAHVFAPTIFRTEFSTSVAPGDPQSLVVSGLEPNTTYYARIYLGDSTRFMASKSAPLADSTLADLPVDPFFSSVSACRATISWLIPSGGAGGYSTEASTTSFGLLSPGGEIKTLATPDGLQVNLTLGGLIPGTLYFFRVASLNWQGDKNFTSLISTATPDGTCLAHVAGLAATHDAFSRAVKLTWINPSDPSPEGVVVMLSANPDPANIQDGTELFAGQILPDGSVVKSTRRAEAISDSGLTLNTTYFYHLVARYAGPVYSVAVSTGIMLDLPPMAQAGLTADLDQPLNQVNLAWSPVTSNIDGTPFKSAASPISDELSYYRVEKSSSAAAPAWVLVSTLPINQGTFSFPADISGTPHIYRVAAVDSFGKEDAAMAVDTRRGVYVYAPGQAARIEIPASLGGEMLAAGNRYGSNILIRGIQETDGLPGNVFSSVRFEAVRTPGNQLLDRFSFSRPELTVAVRYEVSGGNIVPSGTPGPSAISAADAAQRLGLYWNNGEKYVKLYGKVDTLNRLATVQTSMTGSYQLRGLYRDAGVHFDISNLSNRAITPNGDGLNDTAVFLFDNPRDSAFSGRIYDLHGAFVAEMTAGPAADSLQWDGKANGRTVTGGAYVYQIKAEGRVFNGTLLVVR